MLASYACQPDDSRGRLWPERLSSFRSPYQRDRDRIIHTKPFRRLKHKTQVFISPEGDHYRTRMTHTLEVSQIARSIARALRLNEDLTEAIALAGGLNCGAASTFRPAAASCATAISTRRPKALKLGGQIDPFTRFYKIARLARAERF